MPRPSAADRRLARTDSAGRTSMPQRRRLRAPAARASTFFSRRARSTWRRSSVSSRRRSWRRPDGRSSTPRRLVDEVEFSCEDATRSDPAFVARVCRVAIEAGATIINLPDTVGYALPAEYAGFLAEVRRRCPEIRGVTLSVHCHNDLGLAVANSLAGIQAGAGAGRVHRERNW